MPTRSFIRPPEQGLLARFRKPLETDLRGQLGGVVQHARMLAVLDATLRQCLPPELAHRCRLANLRDGTLVFHTSSPAFVSALRLQAPALLEAAAAIGVPAAQVRVKVATMLPVPPDAAPHRPLSPTARDHLRAAAAIQPDPELRALLLRLASMA